MYNLIRVEFYKLRKNRSFWIMLITLAGLSFVYPLLYYYDYVYNGGNQKSGAEILGIFLSANHLIIKIIVALLAGLYISNEYMTGVMKSIASSGNTRVRLYGAKLIGFMAGTAAISVVMPIVNMAMGTLLFGFGHLPDGSSEFYLLRVFVLTMLYSAAFASIGALFAAVCMENGKTVGFSMGFFLIGDLALKAIGSKVEFVHTIYEYSIFKGISRIDQPNFAGEEWGALLLVPIMTLIVASVLGMLVFRRKDIK